MSKYGTYIIIISFFLSLTGYGRAPQASIPDNQWQSKFLKIDAQGNLTYTSDDRGNKIPDFSHVGYNMGNTLIPEVNVVATIHPATGDASALIQNVIDSVAQNVPVNENGFRGAILLKAGTYHINTAIKLNTSGIVLRGEGQGENGTLLIATSKQNGSSLIIVGNSSGSLSINTSTTEEINANYIPVGAKYVVVSRSHQFIKGDEVCIVQQQNQNWISDLKMDQIPPRDDGGDVYQWNAYDYKFNFERKIKRIAQGEQEDTLFFYNPIVFALDAMYSSSMTISKCSFTNRVSHCGVENMQMQSEFASDDDEDHAWNAVYFNRAEHCWARYITSEHFAYACANVSKYAKHITVSHCSSLSPKSIITGERRYSFNCDGQLNLFKYCYASEGRHDFVTGSRVCGPNVFTNCKAEKAYSDIGPHHRWTMGTLYDNVLTDYQMYVRDRSNYGTGHGWTGANQVLWNCKAEKGICQNPWVSAKNYCIGFTGTYVDDKTFGNRPKGEWEGNNVPGLTPESLYFAQKLDRNATIEFGLSSSVATFISDSVFELTFNHALDTLSSQMPENYLFSSNVGVNGNPVNVKLIESNKVQLIFESQGFLDPNKTISIQVNEVLDSYGNPITGWNTASLTIPDLRPAVQLDLQEVYNDNNNTAVGVSSKKGKIYIVHWDIPVQTVYQLDSAISVQQGNVAVVEEAHQEIPISVDGLLPGIYFAYAVDEAGRMSVRSDLWIKVKSSVHADFGTEQHIKLYPVAGGIRISTNDKLKNGQIDVFNLQGGHIFTGRVENQQMIDLPGLGSAVYVVKVRTTDNIYSQKIYLTN